MPYCTIERMIELFGEPEIIQLTNLYSPSASFTDDDRVNAALQYADDEINSYLAIKYSLPLTSVPLVLTSKAADIARYQLDSINPREDVRKRYEDVLKWLRLVADGKIDLGLTPIGEVVGGNSYDVDSYVPDPVFNLEGW